MQQVAVFIQKYFWMLFFIALGWNAFLIATAFFLRGRRPKVDEREILYEEKWQSGFSCRSFWTKLFAAKNCLNIKFLKNSLIIRLHFPMNAWLFSGFEHDIRYSDILEARIHEQWFRKFILIKFRTDRGFDQFCFTAKDIQKAMSLFPAGVVRGEPSGKGVV